MNKMGDQLCERCGTKFEVDNYCENGHMKPIGNQMSMLDEHANMEGNNEGDTMWCEGGQMSDKPTGEQEGEGTPEELAKWDAANALIRKPAGEQYYRDALPLENKDGVVHLNDGRGSRNIVIVKSASSEWTAERVREIGGQYSIRQQRDQAIADAINAALATERVNMETLVDAVEFYADPENYHAILILPDRPSGAFADDFELEHGHPDYDRAMPGKTARAALAKLEEAK